MGFVFLLFAFYNVAYKDSSYAFSLFAYHPIEANNNLRKATKSNKSVFIFNEKLCIKPT